MPLPINNLKISDIANAINMPTNTSIEDLFLSSNVIEEGLDPAYCISLASLRTKPYEIGKWRNYNKDVTSAIACNISNSYPGGEAYPTIKDITLGSDLGIVNLITIPYAKPDRFIVYFNNTVVIDTGYVSNNPQFYEPNSGNSNRLAFNISLYGKVDPILNVTYPNTTHFPDDGFPLVTSHVQTFSFNKTLSNITTAQVRVFAPMDGTLWEFTLTCPE
jgi:hypothetical protein